MPLGNAFPPGQLRSYVEKQLVPGTVLRINFKFPDRIKLKFVLLIAEEDPDCWTFIINSEINPFIQNRPHLLRCQVAIDAASHPFLDHDSHLACHELKRMRREDVIRELVGDLGCIKGPISDDVKAQVISAAKFAKTLSESEKNMVIAALGG